MFPPAFLYFIQKKQKINLVIHYHILLDFAKMEEKDEKFYRNLAIILSDNLCRLESLCYNIKIIAECFGTYIQPEKIGVLTICVKKK